MTEDPESQHAKKHVERIAVLCWIMLALHLLATVGIAVNLLLYLGGDRTLQGQSSTFRQGQAMGQVVGIALEHRTGWIGTKIEYLRR
jgi:membrane protein YdbS with pleckstrin-like domain